MKLHETLDPLVRPKSFLLQGLAKQRTTRLWYGAETWGRPDKFKKTYRILQNLTEDTKGSKLKFILALCLVYAWFMLCMLPVSFGETQSQGHQWSATSFSAGAGISFPSGKASEAIPLDSTCGRFSASRYWAPEHLRFFSATDPKLSKLCKCFECFRCWCRQKCTTQGTCCAKPGTNSDVDRDSAMINSISHYLFSI